MNHFMPVRLITGEGCIEKNGALFSGFGTRCILITGKSAAAKSGALDNVRNVLRDCRIPCCVYDGIAQNPSVSSCMEAGRTAHAFGADFVIGIGGGSAQDAAKAAAVFAANPGIGEEEFYQKNWENAPLPIVLVGTTAGTGSEVTKVSVLTDSRHRKHSIHDDRLFAAAAFGDPHYTMGLSRAITLSTGIDVLSHCAESYFSRKADEISRAFAIRGIRQMATPLRCAADGAVLSLSQRGQLYDASILGGLAICGTGTCFPHNVGYYLTENYGIPHGFASAVFLPDLLSMAEEKMPDYSEQFYRELSITKEELLQLTAACLPELTVTMSEAEINTALPRWEQNNSVRNTCCDVNIEEIRNILEQHFLMKGVN